MNAKFAAHSVSDLKWNARGLRRALDAGKTPSGVVIDGSDRERLAKSLAEIEAELAVRGSTTE